MWCWSNMNTPVLSGWIKAAYRLQEVDLGAERLSQQLQLFFFMHLQLLPQPGQEWHVSNWKDRKKKKKILLKAVTSGLVLNSRFGLFIPPDRCNNPLPSVEEILRPVISSTWMISSLSPACCGPEASARTRRTDGNNTYNFWLLNPWAQRLSV